MVFEGVVISKIPYKERDLIVKLLLRSGSVGSFYIYGGQGGGKKMKPSLFDIGSMMRILTKNPKQSRVEGIDLMTATESTKIWEPEKIRFNIQAYYLTCLYIELLQKFSMPYQADSTDFGQEHEGIFSVISNGLFYMDESLKKDQFVASQQLFLFMVKLIHHLGIMPDTENCSYCSTSLFETTGVSFQPDKGQFACLTCVNAENEKGLLLRLKKSYQTRFQDYSDLAGASFPEADKLIQFFCHHFHLRPIELKAYSLLFK